MNSMKKRILAMILILSMILGNVPSIAFAMEEGSKPNGVAYDNGMEGETQENESTEEQTQENESTEEETTEEQTQENESTEEETTEEQTQEETSAEDAEEEIEVIVPFLMPTTYGTTATETADFEINSTTALNLLNLHKVDQADDSTWSGDADNGYTLTLNGIDFTTSASTAIKLPANTTIVLGSGTTNKVAGGNSTSSSVYGILCEKDVIISGTGTLEVTAGSSSSTKGNKSTIPTSGFESISNSYGIFASNISITGGSVSINAGSAKSEAYGKTGDRVNDDEYTFSIGNVISNANSYGMYAKETIDINNNAQVTAIGGEVDAITEIAIPTKFNGDYIYPHYDDYRKVNLGAYTYSYGIFALKDISISDTAQVTATGGKSTPYADARGKSNNYEGLNYASFGGSTLGMSTKENLNVRNNSSVKAYGGDSNRYCYSTGIFVNGANIADSANVLATSVGAVEDEDSEFSYGIRIENGNFLVSENAIVTAIGRNNARHSSVGIFFDNGDIQIKDNASVSATGGNSTTFSMGIDGMDGKIIHESSQELKATGGEASTSSYGIHLFKSSITQENGEKIIATGGEASTSSYGIHLFESSITQENGEEIIATGGEAETSYGIYMEGSSYENTGKNKIEIKNGKKILAIGGSADNSYGFYGKNWIKMITETSSSQLNASGAGKTNSYGIYASGQPLEITGSGSVIAEAIMDSRSTETTTYSNGIYVDGRLIVSGSKVTATGKDALKNYGINGTGTIRVTEGTVSAIAKETVPDTGESIGIKIESLVNEGGITTTTGENKAFEGTQTFDGENKEDGFVRAGEDEKGTDTSYDNQKWAQFKFGPRISIKSTESSLADEIFCVGAILDKSLLVKATATEDRTISYQWYKNTSDSTVGGAAIAGATNENYKIPETLKKGEYYYFCVLKAADCIDVVTRVVKVTVENSKGKIIGNIKEINNNSIPNATVKLMQGEREIQSITTDFNGAYTFDSVEYGIYSIVVTKDGKTVTIPVTLGEPSITRDITIADGKQNTIIEIVSGSPNMTADLNDLFTAPVVSENNKGITANDKTVIGDGGEVEIKLSSEKKDEVNVSDEAKKIKNFSKDSNALYLYLDLIATKKVTPVSGEAATTILKELNNLVDISIEVPKEYQSDKLRVFRVHEGLVEELGKKANAYGEKITVSDDNTVVTLTVKRFSIYALSPDAVTPPTGGSSSTGESSSTGGSSSNSGSSSLVYHKIQVTAGDGGAINVDKYVMVKNGENFELIFTPDKGYAIADVLIDGKSIGALSRYTLKNITTSHTISVSFKRLEHKNPKTGVPF